MEKNDILDVLEDLGYSGELQDEEKLTRALEEGPASVDYTSCVEWVVKELQEYCGTEESVNAIAIPGEGGENFLMELGAFLREYGCPHTALYEGSVSERLQSTESRLRLLDYLLGELCAVRMIAADRPSKLRVSTQPSGPPEDNESDVAKHMKMMCQALGFPKPPDDIAPFKLFSKIESKVKELITKDQSLLGNPLLKCNLSAKQWDQVMKINTALSEEYLIRREMLLKRLDVTIQSFMWSDAAKRNENAIAAAYQPIRTRLSSKVNITVPAIMAARDDLTRLQKTSSGEARKKTICKINKVLIGRVPDRGGRAWEHEPPPPEMPAFMKRDAAPQRPQSGRGGRGGGGGRGRGGGGGDSGRGGRVQGSWDGQKQSQGGNWSQGGAGYGGGGSYGGQGSFVLGAPGGGGGGQYSNGYQRGDGSYQQAYQQGAYAQGAYQQGGGYQQGYQQGSYQQGYQQSYQGGYDQGGYHQGGGYHGGGGGYHGGGGGGGGGRGGRPGSGRGGRGGGRGGRGKGYH